LTEATTTKTIKIVVLEEKKGDARDSIPKSTSTMRKDILIKSEDLPNPSAYDKVSIDGVMWNFGPIITDDGFIISAKIYREA
jgi:hypothetical protein